MTLMRILILFALIILKVINSQVLLRIIVFFYTNSITRNLLEKTFISKLLTILYNAIIVTFSQLHSKKLLIMNYLYLMTK